jgi:delta14-sterol reductase
MTQPQEEVTITATAEFSLPAKTGAELNPRSRPTEFLGPIGTALVTFSTPAVAYALFYACNEVEGCSVSGAGAAIARFTQDFDWPSAAGKLFELKACAVYAAWYAWCVLCWAVLPNEWIEGNLLRDGTRKKYKMNGEWEGWWERERGSGDRGRGALHTGPVATSAPSIP